MNTLTTTVTTDGVIALTDPNTGQTYWMGEDDAQSIAQDLALAARQAREITTLHTLVEDLSKVKQGINDAEESGGALVSDWEEVAEIEEQIAAAAVGAIVR